MYLLLYIHYQIRCVIYPTSRSKLQLGIHVRSVHCKTSLIICRQYETNFMIQNNTAFYLLRKPYFKPTKHQPFRFVIGRYLLLLFIIKMLLSEDIFHHYLLHTRKVTRFAFQNEVRTIKKYCITTSTSFPTFHMKSNQSFIRKYSGKLKMIPLNRISRYKI